MFGFYLNSEHHRQRKISIHPLTFEQFSNLQDLEKNTLYLFTEAGAEQMVQSGEFNLYAVGALIDKWR